MPRLSLRHAVQELDRCVGARQNAIIVPDSSTSSNIRCSRTRCQVAKFPVQTRCRSEPGSRAGSCGPPPWSTRVVNSSSIACVISSSVTCSSVTCSLSNNARTTGPRQKSPCAEASEALTICAGSPLQDNTFAAFQRCKNALSLGALFGMPAQLASEAQSES